jgi:uncharacterized heparinase superfamily protein
MELIALLSTLRQCYIARQEAVPDFLTDTLGRNIPALLGLTHADGGLGAWQGCGHIRAERIEALVQASGVRARPLRQALDWGYQRVSAGPAVLQVDAGPPPHAKQALVGCASTLAFEFGFSRQRIIINCGGAGLAGANIPAALARGLRTTAAHSTLCASTTAIRPRCSPRGNWARAWSMSSSNGAILKKRRGSRPIMTAMPAPMASSTTACSSCVRTAWSCAARIRCCRMRNIRAAKRLPAHLRFHLGPDIEMLLADDRRSV